ncbi:MAG: alpha/beta hydrolase [Gemmatimonadetes bacterium]|nr:alpha/beta hydrolase [Gemmatimonadota bacterium]
MRWREFQALQKVTEVGDRFVSYVDQGFGEPLILLHGIPTWGYLWHSVLPALARTHRVLVPDLLGFGYSDKGDRFDRSIATQAEMLDGWMQGLGVERADVVAHDIGGGVALRLATLFPQRVRRLGLMHAVCYDSWPIEMMLQFGHPGVHRKVSASTAIAGLKLALKQGFASSPADELLDGILAPYATEVGKLSLVRNAAALNTNLTTEITSLLPRVDAPTLVLWGEEDKFQPVRFGERLAWDIPDAKLVRIPEARHFVMFDQPDAVERHVANFLDQT